MKTTVIILAMLLTSYLALAQNGSGIYSTWTLQQEDQKLLAEATSTPSVKKTQAKEEEKPLKEKEWSSFQNDCDQTLAPKNLPAGRIETWHFNGVEFKKW